MGDEQRGWGWGWGPTGMGSTMTVMGMMAVKGKFAHRIGHGKNFPYLNNNGPALNP